MDDLRKVLNKANSMTCSWCLPNTKQVRILCSGMGVWTVYPQLHHSDREKWAAQGMFSLISKGKVNNESNELNAGEPTCLPKNRYNTVFSPVHPLETLKFSSLWMSLPSLGQLQSQTIRFELDLWYNPNRPSQVPILCQETHLHYKNATIWAQLNLVCLAP